jgi:8-oxo-dGTP pyrophosphatase MutT (NUDIX family)
MTEIAIAPARPAASILFIRDGEKGVEVLMVVRNKMVDFAANALVFPGGKVTAADELLSKSTVGGQHLQPLHRCYAIAALRESFEEAGLLLAMQSDGMPVAETRVRQLDTLRSDIDKGVHSFADMLQSEGLSLQLDQLQRFAHIITPEVAPKRFDTHFYIAPCPPAQQPVIDMREVVDCFWTAAMPVLDQPDGKYLLMRPTRMVLERLSRSATVEAALRDAASFDPPAIEPRFEKRDGQHGLATPEVQGFPANWEPMDDIWAASVGKT